MTEGAPQFAVCLTDRKLGFDNSERKIWGLEGSPERWFSPRKGFFGRKRRTQEESAKKGIPHEGGNETHPIKWGEGNTSEAGGTQHTQPTKGTTQQGRTTPTQTKGRPSGETTTRGGPTPQTKTKGGTTTILHQRREEKNHNNTRKEEEEKWGGKTKQHSNGGEREGNQHQKRK